MGVSISVATSGYEETTYNYSLEDHALSRLHHKQTRLLGFWQLLWLRSLRQRLHQCNLSSFSQPPTSSHQLAICLSGLYHHPTLLYWSSIDCHSQLHSFAHCKPRFSTTLHAANLALRVVPHAADLKLRGTHGAAERKSQTTRCTPRAAILKPAPRCNTNCDVLKLQLKSFLTKIDNIDTAAPTTNAASVHDPCLKVRQYLSMKEP